jgi:hypothetical protein
LEYGICGSTYLIHDEIVWWRTGKSATGGEEFGRNGAGEEVEEASEEVKPERLVRGWAREEEERRVGTG